MARATILGDMIQIKSRLTREQLKRAQEYLPRVATLEDESGNEVFRIEFSNTASFGKYGISFCSTDDKGFMFLTVTNTVPHCDDVETERQKIRDEIGVILHKCNMIEDGIIDVLGELRDISEKIDNSVVIIDDSEDVVLEDNETSVTFATLD